MRCAHASKSKGARAAIAAASSASNETALLTRGKGTGASGSCQRACREARECATHRRMASKEELYDRAIDLFADGKLEEAIDIYRAAIALDSSYSDAWHGLAMAYSELKQHDQAIEAGKRLVELVPQEPTAPTSPSRLYQPAGLTPEAGAHAAKAPSRRWNRDVEERGKA